MSESQQVTTQPEEVKEPQQAADVQVENANDKVVESTEAPVESKSAEQQEPTSENATDQQPASSETTDEKVVAEEKVAENDTKALDGQEQVVDQAEEAKEATSDAAPVEEKETPVEETEKVAEANGDAVAPESAEKQPQAEETNGVSKRKAENGADAVNEEKSPKKAKVVDEGDQSAPAVEERAA